MACLYPKTVKNPRYRSVEPAEGTPLPYNYYVKIPCGKCPLCLKRKSNDWRFRLYQEISHCVSQREVDSNGYIVRGHAEFVTLTFSDKYYKRFVSDPSKAIRLFLERYRKRYGVSLRHFFITELGGERGRLHFHGIVFDSKIPVREHTFDRRYNPVTKKWDFLSRDGLIKKYAKTLRKFWKYGAVWVGGAGLDTVSYIVKYMTKHNEDAYDPNYKQRITASCGIGATYVDENSIGRHVTKGLITTPFVMLNGFKYALPRYYISKFVDTDYQSYYNFLYPPSPSYYFEGVNYKDEQEYNRAVGVYRSAYESKPYAVKVPNYCSELTHCVVNADQLDYIKTFYGNEHYERFCEVYVKPFNYKPNF